MDYPQLTEVERFQIESFLKAGVSQNAMSEELNRHPSAVSQELVRNIGLRLPPPANTMVDGREEERQVSGAVQIRT